MPNNDLIRLGQQLRAARNEAKLTQEQLADLSHVSIKHIAGIEKGQKNPSFEILLALSKVLKLSCLRNRCCFNSLHNKCASFMYLQIFSITIKSCMFFLL